MNYHTPFTCICVAMDVSFPHGLSLVTVNAADNKQRDKSMNSIKITIDA